LNNNLYTYSDFLYDLNSRKIPLYTDLIKKFPKVLNEMVNPDEVLCFYGKGLFNQREKQLYLFFINKVVHIHIDERNVQFRTIKHDVVEANFRIEANGSTGISIEFSNGEKLELNSLDDSNNNWKETYAEMIRVIYKMF
jgi:hypothetical protein